MAGQLLKKKRRLKRKRRIQPTKRMLIQQAGGKKKLGIFTPKRFGEFVKDE